MLAAIGACGGEHLPFGPVATAAAAIAAAVSAGTLLLPCLAARRTALWLIQITPGFIKLLFLTAESKGSPAIGTLDRLVL